MLFRSCTQFYNEIVEDYEDQNLPFATEVIAHDEITDDDFVRALTSNGTARSILPRKVIKKPCTDFCCCHVFVSAKPPVIPWIEFKSERDTLIFDVIGTLSLNHNFTTCDKVTSQERKCSHKNRVMYVQYFRACC